MQSSKESNLKDKEEKINDAEEYEEQFWTEIPQVQNISSLLTKPWNPSSDFTVLLIT